MAALEWGQALLLAGVVVAAVLLAGLLIYWTRTRGAAGKRREPAESVIRSWLAVSLVIGLLVFCAAAFALTDGQLRSTLTGAVAASAGAAVAYYFSSKGADQARQDILNATFGTERVPTLVGSTLQQATSKLGATAFNVEVDKSSRPEPNALVTDQQPSAGSMARKGTSVVVVLKAQESGAGTLPPETSTSQTPGISADPDATHSEFIIGQVGTYTPEVIGRPPPTVAITKGRLPDDLRLDPVTGSITGQAAPGTQGDCVIEMTASNGVDPEAVLSVTLTVKEPPI